MHILFYIINFANSLGQSSSTLEYIQRVPFVHDCWLILREAIRVEQDIMFLSIQPQVGSLISYQGHSVFIWSSEKQMECPKIDSLSHCTDLSIP